MTVELLFEQYMDERQALGFVGKTDRDCIRRFLRDYEELENGKVEFTKEYVLGHIGSRLNQKANTVQREASAINGFLDFVIRKGFTAYKVPRHSLPKQIRNFKAYIFSDDEIERMLDAADQVPPTAQNPLRHHQLPVMFRILFNCGLRSAELRELCVGDVDFTENTLTIRDTKFHKTRIVPFSDSVADALRKYLEILSPQSGEMLLFPSPERHGECGVYGAAWLQVQFRYLLSCANIPYYGAGRGPRPHDTRHTFAVHCLNNWVCSGEDLTAVLPALSRYLGHNGIRGTQNYLQLTAQMYPGITARLEEQFGGLIPESEELYESN